MFWIAMVAIRIGSHLASGWYGVDNHQYLLTYWCAAIGICLLAERKEPTTKLIAVNARLLLGLCFAFAAAWKFIAGEYLNGTFFEYALLSMERFRLIAALLGGDPPTLDANVALVGTLGSVTDAPGVIQLDSHVPNVRAWAMALSLWTIGIELLIAAAVLLPVRPTLARIGDLALLAFIGTTYLFAPVIVFGSLLAVLGMARLGPETEPWVGAYLVALLLLPPVALSVAGIPFLGFLLAGIILFVAAAQARLRSLLIAALCTAGLGAGMIFGHPDLAVASLALGVGLGFVLLILVDVFLWASVSRRVLLFAFFFLAVSIAWPATGQEVQFRFLAGTGFVVVAVGLLWHTWNQRRERGTPGRGALP